MKLLIAVLLTFSSFVTRAQTELHVMTFNIRLDLASDSANAWQYRKALVASQVLFHRTDLLGVQEALPAQMDDLAVLLPGFRYVGTGREDGKRKGEFSAIFYDTARLEVLGSETFWLSPTPEIPGSKGWDAALPRIVTWAKFRDRRTLKVFFHFNTHFDHIGKEARKQSALLIKQRASSLAGKLPAVVTGDFNTEPTDVPYRTMTESASGITFSDAQNISKQFHFGPEGTFNGWKINDNGNPRIDYIFVSVAVSVISHATLSEIWGRRFSSDHFPVLSSLIIN